MVRDLICTFLLLSYVITITVSVTTLEQGPRNKTVFEGDSTSLFCDFSDDNDKPIIWTRVDSGGIPRYVSHNDLIYPQSDVNPQNYQVVVNDDRQTYELVFKRTQVVPDESMYQCGYQYGQNALYKPLATAYLTVLQQEYSFECNYLHLPPEEIGLSAEIEVYCVWNREVVTVSATFHRNGVDIPSDVQFPDRIISRTRITSSSESVMLSCTLVYNVDNAVRMVTKSCSNLDTFGTGNRGIIRVDPLINEVALGSDAVFSCTEGHQSFVQTKFWNIVNMTNVILSVGSRIDNGTQIKISRVQKEDENLLVECRAILQGENVWVSSFATIRVVSSSTIDSMLSLRPTSSYERTIVNLTTDIGITKSSDTTGRTRKIILAIILIFLVIVALIIIIIVFMRRRRSVSLQTNVIKHHSVTYGTNSLKAVPIPHVTVNEGHLTYAVSFKDKRTLNFGASVTSDPYDVAPLSMSGSSVVSLSDVTKDHQGPKSYTSLSTQNKISRFRSVPLLDERDYEMVSSQDFDECEIPRSRSMTTLQCTSSNKRWTSQKMRRSTLKTPPRGRRALSYKKPTSNSDPNVSTEYAQMSIKSRSEKDGPGVSIPSRLSPVYSKPDKMKKTNRYNKTREHKPDLGDVNSYAQSAIGSKDSTEACSNECVDSEMPKSWGPPNLSRFVKKDIKGTSLHGFSALTSAPPKPKRGKCQSQFLAKGAYSVVSDYEIMAQQFKGDNQNDVNQAKSPRYDTPQRSFHQKMPVKGSKWGEEAGDCSHGNGVYEVVDNLGTDKTLVASNVTNAPQYAVYSIVDDY